MSRAGAVFLLARRGTRLEEVALIFENECLAVVGRNRIS
jgi:hypothetical protein